MAAWASWSEPISTNPNPFDRPVSRSMMTCADTTAPYGVNMSCNWESVTPQLRFPTYNFLPTTNSRGPVPAALMDRLPAPDRRAGGTDERAGESSAMTPVSTDGSNGRSASLDGMTGPSIVVNFIRPKAGSRQDSARILGTRRTAFAPR